MKTNHQINLDCAALMGFKYGPYMDDVTWKVCIDPTGSKEIEFDPCGDVNQLAWLSMQTGIGVDILYPDDYEHPLFCAQKVTASYNKVELCTVDVDIRGVLVASCLAIIEADNKINADK